EPMAENTAQKAVDPDLVIHELRLAIRFALRGAQRPHAPDVRIAVDAVPCAVEKNSEALLLLLCACKIRLATTFLHMTNPDPCDDPDENNDPDCVCGPLDQSHNLLHAVALRLHGAGRPTRESATSPENKQSADSVHVARSNCASFTSADFSD